MRTMVPEHALAVAVRFTEQRLVVELEDGREISVPLEWFARLREATPEQRQHFRLIGGGVGIHWPDIDEDLSVDGLLVVQKRAFEIPSTPRLGDEDGLLNGTGGPNVEAV